MKIIVTGGAGFIFLSKKDTGASRWSALQEQLPRWPVATPEAVR
jgi:hypothetical protein